MKTSNPLSILCIASYFKGTDFLKAAKPSGATVYLATSEKHRDKKWPFEDIDEVFYIPQDVHNQWNMPHVINGLAYIMRSKRIDRIIALDDFDVEKAAQLREEFRIPGMGQTTFRHFRDKLAMRMKAKDAGINVPPFSAVFVDEDVNKYITNVPGPWVIKPRSEASATGIKKVNNPTEVWDKLNSLGDERHLFLIEQYRPGDVYHVDAISAEGKVVFSRASQYLSPPMDVSQGGGIFRSITVPFGSQDEQQLLALNATVMDAFGMKYSASHTEYIKCRQSGAFLFLETASRVGGAHLAEMVEASSGINLWAEWARLEIATAENQKYKKPTAKNLYSGIIVSLINKQHPDYSKFSDKEIFWTMNDLDYHFGVIVSSPSRSRVEELLDVYTNEIATNLHAVLPQEAKSSH